MFNSYFHSCYTKPSGAYTLRRQQPQDLSNISSIELEEDEAMKVLLSLNPGKAHGYDGISTRILKEYAFELSSSLSNLFSKSLGQAKVPREWKLVNIIPLFKSGKTDYAGNYRPISLLSVVGKVLERYILIRLVTHVQLLLHPAQHSFVSGKSCTTQILSVLNIIGKNHDIGEETDVFMDMVKAFDRVDHLTLLHMLSNCGIKGNLLAWFGNLHSKLQYTVLHPVNCL